MTHATRWWGLGRRIAPPRFVLFATVLVAGLAGFVPALGLGRGTMAAFDIAAIVFLLSVASLFRGATARGMRQSAADNDANRRVLLGFSGTILLVILVAVAKELQGRTDAVSVALSVATLALAWIFSNMIYTLHYAHLFYSSASDGGDAGGLDFPKCDEPDYWDFAYFAFTLGMTFQTSDVAVTARRVRKVALFQCLAAFVFNLGVLAFSINILGG